MAKECSNSSCSKESCEGCSHKAKPDFHIDLNAASSVKHVIGIVSGKGGVGKSLVCASLANEMAQMGYKVGILDGDITGPSIPRMYGLKGPAMMNDDGIIAPESSNGIKVMSINLLLPNEEDPVVWRGPVIAGTLKQFWTDVCWGDLDYLFVDMPPGTGDVTLTAFQSLPLDGIVIVTSPQSLVKMIVTKSFNMAKMMNIPVLGVVENYSYLACPDCGRQISVFGESHIDDVAVSLEIPVLGRIPIQPEFASAADEGRFAEVVNPFVQETAAAIKEISLCS